MKNELEVYARMTLDQGGIWARIEKSAAGALYSSQRKFSDGRHDFFSTPVYQVFDTNGERVLATLCLSDALNHFHLMEKSS